MLRLVTTAPATMTPASAASVRSRAPLTARMRRNRGRECWIVTWLAMASVSSDRGLGVVLDRAADLAGPVDAGEAGDEVQRHVDAGADAGAGDDVTVVDVPGVAVHVDERVELVEQVEGLPVRGRRSSGEQARRC